MVASALEKGKDSRLTVTSALKAARKAREKYEKFWRRYRNEITGTYYRNGEGKRRFTNYIYMFASTFLPELVARDPEVVVRARREFTDWQTAEVMRLALNAVIRRTSFTDELRLAVLDSFYAFGVMKTGMTPANSDPEAGHQYGDDSFMDPMMPFAERISPWSFIWDDDAKDFKRTSYCGHEFTRDLDVFLQQMKDGIYDRVKADEITTIDAYAQDWERVDLQHYHEAGVEVPPQVRLVEMYVAPTRTLYTLLEEARDSFRVVRKVPSFGPDNGPYRMLGYMSVPDRVVPLAPTVAWFDQCIEHEVNERKLNEQAQAERNLVHFHTSERDSAEKQAKAPDNYIICTDGERGPTNVHWGGVTAERINYTEHARKSLEYMSGINDVRMGAGGESKTATEATLLDRNANIRVADMRRAVAKFAGEVLQDMGWYVWNSEAFEIDTTTYSPEGLPAEVRVSGGVTGDEGSDWPDYALEIDPESLYMDNTAMRRQKAVQDAGFVLGPFMQMLMMQGFTLDMGAFARDFGQKADMPYLEDMIVPASPEAQQRWMAAQQSARQRGSVSQDYAASDGVQGRIMNSETTNGAISQATQAASPMRVANTDPRSYNP